ncbi:hypothetical protein BDV11DRAFT_202085 [Aspergillus similis]
MDGYPYLPPFQHDYRYQRRIAAINAVIAFCDVEEESPVRRPNTVRKRPATDGLSSTPPAKRQHCALPDMEKTTLSQAVASVCVKNRDKRSTICFLCLGNPRTPKNKQFKNYNTPGSLTVTLCSICREELESKAALLNHAERMHGTLSRRLLIDLYSFCGDDEP